MTYLIRQQSSFYNRYVPRPKGSSKNKTITIIIFTNKGYKKLRFSKDLALSETSNLDYYDISGVKILTFSNVVNIVSSRGGVSPPFCTIHIIP